jgi:hypothetical protein
MMAFETDTASVYVIRTLIHTQTVTVVDALPHVLRLPQPQYVHPQFDFMQLCGIAQHICRALHEGP